MQQINSMPKERMLTDEDRLAIKAVLYARGKLLSQERGFNLSHHTSAYGILVHNTQQACLYEGIKKPHNRRLLWPLLLGCLPLTKNCSETNATETATSPEKCDVCDVPRAALGTQLNNDFDQIDKDVQRAQALFPLPTSDYWPTSVHNIHLPAGKPTICSALTECCACCPRKLTRNRNSHKIAQRNFAADVYRSTSAPPRCSTNSLENDCPRKGLGATFTLEHAAAYNITHAKYTRQTADQAKSSRINHCASWLSHAEEVALILKHWAFRTQGYLNYTQGFHEVVAFLLQTFSGAFQGPHGLMAERLPWEACKCPPYAIKGRVLMTGAGVLGRGRLERNPTKSAPVQRLFDGMRQSSASCARPGARAFAPLRCCRKCLRSPQICDNCSEKRFILDLTGRLSATVFSGALGAPLETTILTSLKLCAAALWEIDRGMFQLLCLAPLLRATPPQWRKRESNEKSPQQPSKNKERKNENAVGCEERSSLLSAAARALSVITGYELQFALPWLLTLFVHDLLPTLQLEKSLATRRKYENADPPPGKSGTYPRSPSECKQVKLIQGLAEKDKSNRKALYRIWDAVLAGPIPLLFFLVAGLICAPELREEISDTAKKYGIRLDTIKPPSQAKEKRQTTVLNGTPSVPKVQNKSAEIYETGSTGNFSIGLNNSFGDNGCCASHSETWTPLTLPNDEFGNADSRLYICAKHFHEDALEGLRVELYRFFKDVFKNSRYDSYALVTSSLRIALEAMGLAPLKCGGQQKFRRRQGSLVNGNHDKCNCKDGKIIAVARHTGPSTKNQLCFKDSRLDYFQHTSSAIWWMDICDCISHSPGAYLPHGSAYRKFCCWPLLLGSGPVKFDFDLKFRCRRSVSTSALKFSPAYAPIHASVVKFTQLLECLGFYIPAMESDYIQLRIRKELRSLDPPHSTRAVTITSTKAVAMVVPQSQMLRQLYLADVSAMFNFATRPMQSVVRWLIIFIVFCFGCFKQLRNRLLG